MFCFARLCFSEHEKLRRTQLAKAMNKNPRSIRPRVFSRSLGRSSAVDFAEEMGSRD
ncbi:hypothetical protein CLOSTMETH_03714 [[Clostridium] methylpentosum DSM 5476]|uniref:Uncharacterized protein n=1 Tax=[Clostridium] methylpentosum DSM 5476 TaxID=537013 RepID=C0EIL9_9FIRM|nr:hypothetical protein CLOSTMETH_03714 [[Clostridium] methylpentosum DSM 5476]